MKIRMDFVTLTITDACGKKYELQICPRNAFSDGGSNANLKAIDKEVFGASSVAELVAYLTDNIEFVDADLFFEYESIELDKYTVGNIRKVVDKIPGSYFQSVIAAIDAFREKVTTAVTDINQIAFVQVDNIHNAQGESCDPMDYFNRVGLEVPEEGESDICGKTFVVTGELKYFANREELTEFIEENLGNVAGRVSKNTDYLINNDADSASAKNKKAAQMGITVITEKEFILTLCDPVDLSEEVLEKLDEIPEYRDRLAAALRTQLTPDSTIEALADFITDDAEVESISGTVSKTFDMASKTMQKKITITME